ncbi:MAG: S8 family serine peptidase, partial [Phycisphaerae bacterium]|nr:S8 family serine peptidase [Phycisphaerae bacterium]
MMLRDRSTLFSAALCGLLVGTSFPASAQTGSVNEHAGVPVPAVARVDTQFRLQLGPDTVIRVSDRPIHNPRMTVVPGAPSRLVLWEEDEPIGRQPYYAVSLDGQRFARPRPADYQLRLRHGDFDPCLTERAVDDRLTQSPASNLYIVQFPVPPLEDFRKVLRSLGATVHNYLPHYALLVRMDAGTRTAVEALPFVRWVGPYHPAYRLDPALAAAVADASLPASAVRYRIQMIDAGPSEQQALLDRIATIGGTVDAAGDPSAFVQATLTPEQLRQVVQMDEVLFVDRQGKPVTLMDKARAIGGANYIETAGGYTGLGVHGEVMDSGCQTDHPAFASRLTVRRGPAELDSHGTSTFGINFGDGTGSATGRGLLPSGNGVFSMWNSGDRVNDAAQLVSSTWQCLYQSNSWGTSEGEGYSYDYNSASSELDQAVYLHDLVVVQGQGNYRYSGSLREAWAKNIVSVGGIHHQDTLTKSDDYWYGASIGPAADDRIKPDLCHFYDGIRTTTAGSGYTSDFGGTSGATPIVAGHFGLFFQMWADGLFGNPVGGGSVFAERAHSATARAAIFNTASAYSFSGTGHNLTRTHQGWGLPDLQYLYDRRNNIRVVDETDILLPFETATYERTIVAGQPYHNELRVTLVYTDYYGTT